MCVDTLDTSLDTSLDLDFDFAQLVLVGSCAQGGHPNSGPLICTAGPCSCIYIFFSRSYSDGS